MSILLQRATGSNGHTPPIDRLLPRLRGVTKTSNGWDALCPAHADTRPSLGIAAGADGTVLLRCRSRGCTAAEITAALGLSVADLFPPARAEHQSGSNGAARRIVAKYPYRDENGELLFEVVRFDPKDFRQRRPDGKGGWRWSVAGARRVPYRLPELLAAEPDWPCFITEGEKDADALAELGLLATTCPGGAGKWGALDPEAVRRAFAGRPVYVLVDNDDAGRAHALDVARRLRGIAKNIRLVELPGLPPKGDVSDWLAAGHTRDELTFASDDTPEWSPPPSDEKAASAPRTPGLVAVCAADVRPRETEWLWERVIPYGAITIIDGDPGLGKSSLAIDVAARLTTGRPMPPLGGAPVGPGQAVCLLSAEDAPQQTIIPRLVAAGADRSRVHLLSAAAMTDGTQRPIQFPADSGDLEALIAARGVRLVAIDPLMAFFDDATNTHRDSDVRRVLFRLREVAERTGCAVVLIRHLNKLGSGSAIYRGTGSIGIVGAARSALLVGRHPHERDQRVLAPVKCNLCPMPPSLHFALEAVGGAHRIKWLGECSLTADEILTNPGGARSATAIEDCKQALADALKDGPADADEVSAAMGALGYSQRTVARARAALGLKSRRVGFGREGKWMLFGPE